MKDGLYLHRYTDQYGHRATEYIRVENGVEELGLSEEEIRSFAQCSVLIAMYDGHYAEGFKAGIEAAAKLIETHRVRLKPNGMGTGGLMLVKAEEKIRLESADFMAEAIRALKENGSAE